MPTKLIAVAAAVAITLGSGFWRAASGTRHTARASQAAELGRDLAEGHRALRDAGLDLSRANVAGASRRLDAARALLRDADARLTDLGWIDDARQVRTVLVGIDDARRLIERLGERAAVPESD